MVKNCFYSNLKDIPGKCKVLLVLWLVMDHFQAETVLTLEFVAHFDHLRVEIFRVRYLNVFAHIFEKHVNRTGQVGVWKPASNEDQSCFIQTSKQV